MTDYTNIPKSLVRIIHELTQSLLVIRDSLLLVKQGNPHQIIPLFGQLRALLTDTSKIHHNKPLLFHISDILNFPLNFYFMPSDNDPPPFKDSLLYYMSGFPLSLNKELIHQQYISLTDFLDVNIVEYKKNSYTPRDFINWFANKAGGAHYATDIPKVFAELLSIRMNNEPIILNGMYQIGQIVFELGRELLRSISDFDLYVILVFPKQNTLNIAYILDALLRRSLIRFSIILIESRRIKFRIIGVDGQSAEVQLKRLVALDEPHQFCFTHHIDDMLCSVIGISIDGQSDVEYNIGKPIFILNKLIQYDMFVNRSKEEINHAVTLGIATIAMYGRKLNPIENAKNLLYLEDNRVSPDTPYMFYISGSYGNAKPHSNNIKMHGKVEHMTLSEYIKSDYSHENNF